MISNRAVALTNTQCQVEEAHANVKPEEKDDVCHFAEKKEVPHMLLHSD